RSRPLRPPRPHDRSHAVPDVYLRTRRRSPKQRVGECDHALDEVPEDGRRRGSESLLATPTRPALLTDLREANEDVAERSDRNLPELGNPSDRFDQRAIVDIEVAECSDVDEVAPA